MKESAREGVIHSTKQGDLQPTTSGSPGSIQALAWTDTQGGGRELL